MMIRKISDEHRINFLEKENNSKNSKEDNIEIKKTLAQLSEEQKAKKINNKDDGLMTVKNIRSAISGVIKDDGGPVKFIKSETSNTIWENNKSERLSKEIDSQTRAKIEKEKIADNKRIAEQKRMDDIVSFLKETEQSKDSNVSQLNSFSGSKYYSPKNNMSIFDTKEFERLAERSEGERISDENNEKKAQKDESWKNSGKQVSSKDFVNRFFDSLLKKE